jgi:hypothetical protein
MQEIVDNVQVIQGAGKIFRIMDPRPMTKNRPYTYGLRGPLQHREQFNLMKRKTGATSGLDWDPFKNATKWR